MVPEMQCSSAALPLRRPAHFRAARSPIRTRAASSSTLRPSCWLYGGLPGPGNFMGWRGSMVTPSSFFRRVGPDWHRRSYSIGGTVRAATPVFALTQQAQRLFRSWAPWAASNQFSAGGHGDAHAGRQLLHRCSQPVYVLPVHGGGWNLPVHQRLVCQHGTARRSCRIPWMTRPISGIAALRGQRRTPASIVARSCSVDGAARRFR